MLLPSTPGRFLFFTVTPSNSLSLPYRRWAETGTRSKVVTRKGHGLSGVPAVILEEFFFTLKLSSNGIS